MPTYKYQLTRRSAVTERPRDLSLRDRATLHVIEYFAKSLKVIRNDIVAQGVSLY